MQTWAQSDELLSAALLVPFSFLKLDELNIVSG